MKALLRLVTLLVVILGAFALVDAVMIPPSVPATPEVSVVVPPLAVAISPPNIVPPETANSRPPVSPLWEDNKDEQDAWGVWLPVPARDPFALLKPVAGACFYVDSRAAGKTLGVTHSSQEPVDPATVDISEKAASFRDAEVQRLTGGVSPHGAWYRADRRIVICPEFRPGWSMVVFCTTSFSVAGTASPSFSGRRPDQGYLVRGWCTLTTVAVCTPTKTTPEAIEVVRKYAEAWDELHSTTP